MFKIDSYFQITRGIISFLNNISENTSSLLSLLLMFTILHFIFSLLLTVSIRLDKRELLLPWLVTHLIIILVKITIFSFTTFITFFIDLLVSVVFPLITGMVLGVSLLIWRLVLSAYTNNLYRLVMISFGHLAKILMQRNISAKRRKMTVIKAPLATS